MTISNGTVESEVSGNGSLLTIPSEYIPKINVEFIETINKTRFIIRSDLGYIQTTSNVSSGTLIRGSVTYVTAT